MNLAKAKEISKDAQTSLEKGKFYDHADAVGILIEAASWMLLARVTTPGSVPTLLNGETED